MRIIINSAEKLAEKAAEQYVQLLSEKPDAVLGLATGSTPLKLYDILAELSRSGRISFKRAASFNLDEYVGLDGTHDQSYRYFMDKNLFSRIDIDPAKTFVPSGLDTDTAVMYDEKIANAGGIDLQLLGLGLNGHIGFNEPGSSFGSLTHVVKLTESTREANKRFFHSIDEVPTHAVTMGIKSVMNAKAIILIATGRPKAEAVRAMIKGEVTAQVPASILQLHPDVTVYLDEEAAALL